MKKEDLLFKEGDVIEHLMSKERCIVGKIEKQRLKDPVTEKREETYTYSLGVSIEKSFVFQAEKAHQFFKKI